VWQLLGFYLGWKGELGSGRALGLGELKLSAQIVPTTKIVKYVVDIKRVISGKLVMGIGDGTVYADGEVACKVSGMKVGLFDNSAAA
ncbi:MAG: beta-hydroxydecanoyl-ACP dehydratase, partial [Bdellovibrionales bacterium]